MLYLSEGFSFSNMKLSSGQEQLLQTWGVGSRRNNVEKEHMRKAIFTSSCHATSMGLNTESELNNLEEIKQYFLCVTATSIKSNELTDKI